MLTEWFINKKITRGGCRINKIIVFLKLYSNNPIYKLS